MAKKQSEPALFDGSDQLVQGEVVDEPGTSLAPVEAMAGSMALASPAQNTERICSMLEKAVERGVDPDVLERLVALQERVMAKQAEAEFNAALMAFQSQCPVIGKTSKSDRYMYAKLDYIVSVIRPYLKLHGLSFSFDSSIVDGKVSVTCIVSHAGGHSKQTQFAAPIPSEMRVNETQKFAAATSYGRRYALVLALGLTTGDYDDDGRSLTPEHPNPEGNPDAPRGVPRDERLSKAEVDAIKNRISPLTTAWQKLHPMEPGEAKSAYMERFKRYVRLATNRDFDPGQPGEWTDGDFDAVDMALSALGEETNATPF